MTCPTGTYALPLSTARWALHVCHSLCVRALLSGSRSPREWLPVPAADALTGASIIAPPFPEGDRKCSIRKNRPRCDPELQTEVAVMDEAWGPGPQ